MGGCACHACGAGGVCCSHLHTVLLQEMEGSRVKFSSKSDYKRVRRLGMLRDGRPVATLDSCAASSSTST